MGKKLNYYTHNALKWAKMSLGIVALVLGTAGILLPILPGWILIFLGLELIGIKILFIDNIKEYALRKLREEKRGKR